MRSTIVTRAVLSLLVAAAAKNALAQTPPGGFRESFALATDRNAALAQLIPGTEDHFYFSCLLRQHEGKFDEVPLLLAAWIERHGRTERVDEIELRQTLLSFDRDPGATSKRLIERLSLSFDWQQQVPGKPSTLPTKLDETLLDRPRLLLRALEQHRGSLDGLGSGALREFAKQGVPTELLRPLLDRIDDASMPGLVELIVRELRMADAGRWGSRGVHAHVTLLQLREIAQQRGNMLQDAGFVAAIVQRMQPSADVDLAIDDAARLQHLEGLEQFVTSLPDVHSSLKAHVLFHRLKHDLARGVVEDARLEAYLRLPHPGGRTNPEWVERLNAVPRVQGNADFQTGLPRIGSDDRVVRACFEQLFATADSFDKWTSFVRADWVKRLFAETKLLRGEGDMARWYAMLEDASGYEQIVNRVELSFAPTQPARFAADAAAAIEVDVKNVPMLLVKLYRIDAAAYLRDQGKPVDASIDLDGLVANEEQVAKFTEPPVRRVRRAFQFDALKQPGVYVVELVGNGVSSRAVIHKGALRLVERTGSAGLAFSVFDERGQHVKDAVGWYGGREIAADEDGEIRVPFSADPGQHSIVVRSGSVASLHRFAHPAEAPELALGAFVERESMVGGERCRLVVRPRLSIAGQTAPMELLAKAELRIVASTRDGAAPTQTVPIAAFARDGEYVHEFEVPRGLKSLSVSLHGSYAPTNGASPMDLAASAAPFVMNGIEQSAEIGVPLLGRAADGWFLELRGRNGEPIVGSTVSLQFRMRDFRDGVDAALQTDASGRIALGRLDGVDAVNASVHSSTSGSWTIRDRIAIPRRMHGVAGETLRLPLHGADSTSASSPTLYELRGGCRAVDAAASLAMVDGVLELRSLLPGDYELCLPMLDARIAVAVTAGVAHGAWFVSPTRALRSEGRSQLAIRAMEATDDEVTVRLHAVAPDVRVHVFASRYQTAFSPLALSLPRLNPSSARIGFDASECDYQQGRQVSDELRYVLERRYASKRAGNMLPQPSLLLNPWALEQSADAGRIGGGKGGGYGGRAGGVANQKPESAPSSEASEANPHAYAALDFLGAQAGIVANVRPDQDGVVRVARKLLGSGQMISAVAVSEDGAVVRTIALPRKELAAKDLRLARAFDAATPMAEQERIEFVRAGESARIADVTTSKLRPYATIADAHKLLSSVSGAADLAKFAFVTRWNEIGDDERRALYREHACHELHLFVYFKDRAWFDAVLRPYLANKAHREFLDEWMLGSDVSDWLEPQRFARLNLVEQILLLQRMPGQQEALRRFVAERADVLPVDLDRQRSLFLAALRAGDLESGSEGLAKLQFDMDAGGWDDRNARAETKGKAAELREYAGVPRAGGGRGLAEPGAPTAGGPATAGPGGPPAPAPNEVAAELAEAKSDMPELRDAEKSVAQRKLSDEKDLKERSFARALFREPDATRIFAEQAYWRTPVASQSPDVIAANAFWRDFAASSGVPFVSAHLASASGTFTEAMLALAVSDLPFAAEAPTATRDGSSLTLQPKSGMLLARSEMLPAQQRAGIDPVLIRQACFRLDDRYAYDGAQQRQKNVAGEFLTGVAYGCQVVLTNPTDAPRRLSLLLQVPAGAMPLHGGPSAWSAPVALDAFGTRTMEYLFYFPAVGDFAHYPPHVSQDGALAGAADAAVRKVVATPTVVDTKSWEHVSQLSSLDELLAWMSEHNLLRVDLSRIAWRLRDKEAFRRVVELLRSRMCFDPTVWSFSLLHGDRAVMREFLGRREDVARSVRGYLRSPLLDIDPVERRAYEHLEFDPLIHARAHRIGAWQKIQNPELERQWIAFVDGLCKRPALDSASMLEVSYYLMLQGRIDEAMAAFERVDAAAVDTKLQRDYLAAWFAFGRADVAGARAIAKPYADHPVERWRAKFRAVLQQADEADGAAIASGDPRDLASQQTQLAATEPQLDLTVEAGQAVLACKNVARVELRYHRLDIEAAFSASPFAQQGLVAAGWVEPMRVDSVAIDPALQETKAPLPAEFAQGNVVVEARANGIVRRAQSLSSAMNVQVAASYGQVEVRSKAGVAMPAVYVKCYARGEDGRVQFHKDGYTDLRGRFDYASVTEKGGSRPVRFSLLVLSEKDGAVLREVDPPTK